MLEWDGTVWIVEHNHAPMVRNGRVVSFPCGGAGTNALRKFLNALPQDEDNYYDGLLYESRAKQSLNRGPG